jgi:hypothetical protein
MITQERFNEVMIDFLISDEELNSLDEAQLFEFLDAKTLYLRQYSRPLTPWHKKVAKTMMEQTTIKK